MKARISPRLALLVIAGLFLLPLVLAWLMYSGAIEGVGPRYCPSVEDKVVRFADKTAHQIFIEPEGLDTNELYPNGISTSLPFDVQLEFVRSIEGFEKAHITRPGYAIEYCTYCPTICAGSVPLIAESLHVELGGKRAAPLAMLVTTMAPSRW